MVDRIVKFEKILNESESILKDLEIALNNLEENQKNYLELKEYYGSEEYLKDVDSDNSTTEYEGIDKGVLSEDSVYNLICKNYDVYIRMLELTTKLLKEH